MYRTALLARPISYIGPIFFVCVFFNKFSTLGYLAFHYNGRVELVATRPRGYKTFFMLNSVEHEIFPAHKY